MRETRWAYYDRENYKIYEQTGEREGQGEVRLTAAGRHGLARNQRVPLFDLEVSEGLWLMNRAGLLQLEHFNKSNSLAWALTMGLFAMLSDLFRARLEPDHGRILLRATQPAGPIRMDRSRKGKCSTSPART